MTPIEAFIQQAGHGRSLWRPIAGLALILLIWALMLIPVALVFIALYAAISGDPSAALHRVMTISVGGGPIDTMFILSGFSGLWLGVMAAGRWLHRQKFGAFFAPIPRLRPAAFLKGAGLGLACATLSALPVIFLVDDIRPGLEPARLAVFLLPLILLIFIQASAEELVFRGYLLQQLGAWSRHWLVWALLPSLLFGFVHYDPALPDGGGYYYVVAAVLMGLLFAAVVRRSGTLWSSIGLHMAINLFGLTMLGAEGVMSGTQMWLVGKSDLALAMKLDIVSISALLLLVLSPLGRFLGPEVR